MIFRRLLPIFLLCIFSMTGVTQAVLDPLDALSRFPSHAEANRQVGEDGCAICAFPAGLHDGVNRTFIRACPSVDAAARREHVLCKGCFGQQIYHQNAPNCSFCRAPISNDLANELQQYATLVEDARMTGNVRPLVQRVAPQLLPEAVRQQERINKIVDTIDNLVHTTTDDLRYDLNQVQNRANQSTRECMDTKKQLADIMNKFQAERDTRAKAEADATAQAQQVQQLQGHLFRFKILSCSLAAFLAGYGAMYLWERYKAKKAAEEQVDEQADELDAFLNKLATEA